MLAEIACRCRPGKVCGYMGPPSWGVVGSGGWWVEPPLWGRDGGWEGVGLGCGWGRVFA